MDNTHSSLCAPAVQTAGIPPGWHLDETTGALMRDVIHRMGRRAFRWDYCGTGAYLITMTVADRSQPLFGRLVGDNAEAATIELSPLGREIDAHLRRIGEYSPEIEVLAAQLMPEHLHAVLQVKRRMEKPLGIALRGFKGGASQIYWRFAAPVPTGPAHMSAHAAKRGLFSPGFVDNILGDDRAIKSAVAYTLDNPRRLWEKRNHPELFQVLRELPVRLALGSASAHCAPAVQTAGLCAPALPCAGGNLLMLAPAAWPYVPGEKPMTRIDACILNRLAQWLAGSGATEIQYRGVAPARINELAAAAVKLAP